tara:strand:- start:232 stop:774 length:543 start_codon:yes stop_codon:yes gene_type:complete
MISLEGDVMWFDIIKVGLRQQSHDDGLKNLKMSDAEYALLPLMVPGKSATKTGKHGIPNTNKGMTKKIFHNQMMYYYLTLWRFDKSTIRQQDNTQANRHREAKDKVMPMPGNRYAATYDRKANNVAHLAPKAPSGKRWDYNQGIWVWRTKKNLSTQQYTKRRRLWNSSDGGTDSMHRDED